MCQTVEEARAHVLALLNRGYSPEQVEELMAEPGCVLVLAPKLPLHERTALSDPSNVLMVEVVEDGAAD